MEVWEILTAGWYGLGLAVVVRAFWPGNKGKAHE